MFARVARYEISPDRLAEAVKSFEQAGAGLSDFEGFQRGYVLLDEDDGALITLTLWSTRSALESSETRAGLLRRRAVQAADGSVQSVHCYEVAVELGH
jgi:heme-degrading monooxygenase HmoA